MHRTSPAPARTATTRRAGAARRLTVVAAAAALLLTGPAPAQATTGASSPIGNFERVVDVPSGLDVRGWVADRDTDGPVTLKVTVGGTTRSVVTSVSRPDVPRVFPDLGPTTGFSLVVPLPRGSHQVCVTAVNVGSGADTVFPCRTGTVTVGTPVATPAPVPVPTAAPAPATSTSTSTSRPLSWAPPRLSNPITVTISATNRVPRLRSGQDYIIKMPRTPLDVPGGLILSGGRNVVLIGGQITISRPGTTANSARGLYLKGQSGTVHVEGLRITGAALADAINLDQRNGATVQLQNIRVDTVHGSYRGRHADILQTWAGPRVLRVDGLTGHTTYQGLFLTPSQYGPTPALVDLRNVNIVGQTGSKYLMWRESTSWPLRTHNVWAKTSQVDVPRTQYLRGSWGGVQSGTPAGGDIVPAGRAGTRYVSPGYR